MGRRGPAPLPTKLKLIRGNPGKRKLPAAEPAPPIGRPECPSWLNDEAAAEWERLLDILERMQILSTADRGMLAVACEAWSELVDACAALAKEGHVCTTDKGNQVQNPWVGIKNRAAQRYARALQEFGLSPASRSRVAKPKEKGTDARSRRFFKTG